MTDEASKEKGIPDKLYYRIGEVSRIVGVEPHVLRYWESEFPFLKPSRVVSKQRLYKRKDVEMLLRIMARLGLADSDAQEGRDIPGRRRRT